MKIKFLPTYSPNLAPIEICFAFIKLKFASKLRCQKLNIESKQSQNAIFNIMKLLTKERTKKFFKKIYEEIKL